MNERDTLRKLMNDGNALDELRNHHGWKEFSKVVQELYTDNLILLSQHENNDARSMVKAITELNERFMFKINLAKDAAEQLKQDKFKEPWDTAA